MKKTELQRFIENKLTLIWNGERLDEQYRLDDGIVFSIVHQQNTDIEFTSFVFGFSDEHSPDETENTLSGTNYEYLQVQVTNILQDTQYSEEVEFTRIETPSPYLQYQFRVENELTSRP